MYPSVSHTFAVSNFGFDLYSNSSSLSSLSLVVGAFVIKSGFITIEYDEDEDEDYGELHTTYIIIHTSIKKEEGIQ